MSEKSEDLIQMQEEEEKENQENESWQKIPNIKVLSINYNQNKTLLVLSTNYGYRIYDVLNNFKLVSTLDQNQKDLGPLKKAKLLYKSSLIGFVGDRDNERFKENVFCFYSDEYKKILSKISFNQNIKDFYISSSLLFICFVANIYVFELHSMKYIHCIPHCLFKENLFSFIEDPLEESDNEEYTNNNKVISVGYVSTYQNDIKIQRYIINKNIPKFVVKDEVLSDFGECPEMIKLLKGFKIIVISKNGNKLHIYDYVNNSLLYCHNLTRGSINIKDISFGLKNKFLMIHYNLYQFDIIKIKKDYYENGKPVCTCTKSAGNKYGYRKLKTYDFGFHKNNVENAFCSGNITDIKGVNNLCIKFDPKQKDIINIIDNNGYLTKYQFDRKEKGDKLKKVEHICLFEKDNSKS